MARRGGPNCPKPNHKYKLRSKSQKVVAAKATPKQTKHTVGKEDENDKQNGRKNLNKLSTLFGPLDGGTSPPPPTAKQKEDTKSQIKKKKKSKKRKSREGSQSENPQKVNKSNPQKVKSKKSKKKPSEKREGNYMESPPWWSERNRNEFTQDGVQQESSTAKSTGYLKNVPHRLLRLLDAELASFANYVRLTDVESRARNFLVNEVERSACNFLSKMGNKNHRDQLNQTNNQKIKVNVFGSYATPAVCAFCSDVDMALFGVVPPDDPLPRSQDKEFSIDSEPTTNNRKAIHLRFQEKREKIQKWKDLLDGEENRRASLCVHDDDDDDDENENSRADPSDGGTMERHEDVTTRKRFYSMESDMSSKGGDLTTRKRLYSMESDMSSKAPSWQNALDRCLEGSNEHLLIVDKTRHGSFSEETAKTTHEHNDQAIDSMHQKRTVIDLTSSEKDSSGVDLSDKEIYVKGKDQVDVIDLSKEPESEENHLTEETMESGIGFVIDRVGADDTSANPSPEDPNTTITDANPISKNEQQEETTGTQSLEKSPDVLSLGEGKSDTGPMETNFSKKRKLQEINVDAAVEGVEVERNEEHVVEQNDCSSDSDDDSADKLASLHTRQTVMTPELSDSVKVTNHINPKPTAEEKKANFRTARTISLSSTNSSDGSENNDNRKEYRYTVDGDVDDDDDVDNLDVSFVVKPATTFRRKVSFGPQGETRKKVIKALNVLGNAVRRSVFTTKLDVIRGARVPIVKLQTCFGFEGDIAIGGHNGTDTSHYAMSQVKRYRSFAAVVLALKIILEQNDLDKPFTGGLGSYKLYVLVSHHLERHMAMGGSDCPGEVFLTFLLRFGSVSKKKVLHRINQDTTKCQTKLTKTSVIRSGDAVAELGAVHLIDNVVGLFQRCWIQLWGRYNSNNEVPNASVGSDKEGSILSELLDVPKLQKFRKQCRSKAELVHQMEKRVYESPQTQVQKRIPISKKANARARDQERSRKRRRTVSL